MADRPIEPGKYDPKQTPERNATVDSTAIIDKYKTDGAEAAYQAMQKELDPQQLAQRGVTEQQRTEYQTKLVEQLQKSGVLPEISIAAVKDRAGKPADQGGTDLQTGNRYDINKVRAARDAATNPVDRALYTAFADKYDDLRNGNRYAPVNDATLTSHMDRTNAAARAKAQDDQFKKDISVLATRPEVFDAIDKAGTESRNRAGVTPEKTDGKITDENIAAFDKKWNDPDETARKKFRETFGTQEQQDQVDRAVKALRGGLEQNNLTNNNMVEGRYNPFVTNGITKDTLTAGLGGPEAVAKYKQQENTRPDGTVRPEVAAAQNFADSKLNRGEGPWHVANQMMKGQEGSFQDPAKAQRDLTKALQASFTDRQGAEQLANGGRDKVREEIRKSGNTELLNWFDKRYPKPEGPEKPVVKPEPTAVSDFSGTVLKDKNDGPRAIAGRMTQGQEQFFQDPAKATKDLARAIGTEFGIHNSKQGAPQVTKENYDNVVEAIKKTQNAELLAWFQKRYPKPKA
ncbi:MAG: hypothetical protein K2Y39_01300 [Candidatus Obscuribacterales bacterium]|nr:hypothetical protein [Candidatus Obscuribacterales bacterium]